MCRHDMVLHQCTSAECICLKRYKIISGKPNTTPCTELKETLIETTDIGSNGSVPKTIKQIFQVIRRTLVNKIENYKALAVTSFHSLYIFVSMAFATPLNGYFAQLSQGNVSQQESMKYEPMRISTYAKFPKHIPFSALQLSKAGYFYTGSGDEIQCFSCQFKIKDLVNKADPISIHKTNSPNCPFLQNSIDNLPVHNIAVTNTNHTTPGLDIAPEISDSSLSETFQKLTTVEQSDAVTENEMPNRTPFFNSNTQHILAPTATTFHPPSQSNSSFFPSPPSDSTRVNPSQPEVETAGDFRYESTRLASYQNWPTNAAVLPEELAKSGFYYTGTVDRVQCTFCRGILKSWEPGDQPDTEHRRHFGQCPFLMNPLEVGNIPINDDNGSSVEMFPGIVTEKPVYQRYSLPSDRLATYADFPSNMVQTPEMFTRAGFFYTGTADNLKCFFCDGGLRNWEPNDDPWTEHARWFPRCGYLRLCKGEEFIKQVQDLYAPPSKKRNAQKYYRKRKNFPVDQTKVTEYMSHPMVRSVVDMGYDMNKIRQVIINRMQELGDDFFPNAESMLDAVTEYEDELKYKEINGEEEEDEPEQSQDAAKQSPNETTTNKPLEYMTEEEVSRLEEEVQQMKDQRICKVCMDAEVNVVFLRCGHLVCCANCAPAMRHCPVCREIIRGTTRVYMS